MRTREETQARNKRLKKTAEGRALLGLLEECGGNTGLADTLLISPSVVSSWVRTGHVSKRGAELIQAQLGINREALRPDVKDWSCLPGRDFNAKADHSQPDQLLLRDLAANAGSVRALCESIGAKVGHFHNWKSRNQIPASAVRKLLELELPGKLRKRLERIPV